MLEAVQNPDNTWFTRTQLLFAATPARAIGTVAAATAVTVVFAEQRGAWLITIAAALWVLWCARTAADPNTRVTVAKYDKYRVRPNERLVQLAGHLDAMGSNDAVHDAKAAVYRFAKQCDQHAGDDAFDDAAHDVYEHLIHAKATCAGIDINTARFFETHLDGNTRGATSPDIAVVAAACDVDVTALQRYVLVSHELDVAWVPTRHSQYMRAL